MTRKERYAHIIQYFKSNFPDAQTELHYKNPYQLIVAVILSAQCTDKRVNMVTPHFFKSYPDFLSLSVAQVQEVFTIIKSISYPNNKAKHLCMMAHQVINEYKGTLPQEVKDLEKLAGVGRKTANVLASVLYNKPVMAVDTHVFRVSHRLGLVGKKDKTPLAVEKTLTKNILKTDIHIAHHWLILHGRYTCKAIRPRCQICPLTDICNYYNSQSR